MEVQRPVQVATEEETIAFLDKRLKEITREAVELFHIVKSQKEELDELRKGLEPYTEEWVIVGLEQTGPVLASTYNEAKGGCEDKWIPEGVQFGIYEPPKRIKGLKHYKAAKHMNAANKIRDKRNEDANG
jgi:hypothetical protein